MDLGGSGNGIAKLLVSKVPKTGEYLRVGATIANGFNARTARRFNHAIQFLGCLWLFLNATMIWTANTARTLELLIPGNVCRCDFRRKCARNAHAFDYVKRTGDAVGVTFIKRLN